MKFKKPGYALMAAISCFTLALTGCKRGGDEPDEEIYVKPTFEGELEYDEDGKIIFDNVEVTMWSIIGDPDLTIILISSAKLTQTIIQH